MPTFAPLVHPPQRLPQNAIFRRSNSTPNPSSLLHYADHYSATKMKKNHYHSKMKLVKWRPKKCQIRVFEVLGLVTRLQN
jgi:hypothetical protein